MMISKYFIAKRQMKPMPSHQASKAVIQQSARHIKKRRKWVHFQKTKAGALAIDSRKLGGYSVTCDKW